MADERLLTVDEVAERLSVHRETVRRMLRDRKLRGTQPMTRRAGWRITEGELARFIAGAPVSAPPAPRTKPKSATLLANLRAQAEQARARGDTEGAATFERMAAGLGAGE